MLQSKEESSDFLKKNVFFIAIIALFVIMGENNTIFLVSAIAVIILKMIFSSYEHRFCWSLFLVPNIRLFDNFGFTFMTNILLAVPSLCFYFFDTRKKKFGFLSIAFILFNLEAMHKLIQHETINNLFGWISSFLWCCYATLDKDIYIDKSDATYSLASGAIFSGTVFLIKHPDFTNNLIQKVVVGNRFEAYASDPNAYSTYLCLALSALLIKNNLKILDSAFIIVLTAFGLLTTSKMCIILLAISIIYWIMHTLKDFDNIKSIIIIALMCFAVYYFRDTIIQLLEKVLTRATRRSGDISLDSITSNRYKIQMNYLDILLNDSQTLLFGKGFTYYKHLNAITSQQAHNTYLDIILSWGLTGLFVFICIMFNWVVLYKQKLHTISFKLNSKLPTLILLFSFLSLSFFSASMFFFIVSFCMLQLEPKNIYNENEGKNMYDFRYSSNL